MTRMRMALGLIMGLTVSACATQDTATRRAPVQAPAATVPVLSEPVMISDFNISVPRSLKVSEANRYYPGGDIVWRGEPLGDRHQQVAGIFKDSLDRARNELSGVKPVTVNIQVTRFHALTEKARYTYGGVHAITFDMTVVDSVTGAVLLPTRTIRADLDAFGGQRAIHAERNGITQKVRITSHLKNVIESELTRPGSHTNHATGIIGAINQL